MIKKVFIFFIMIATNDCYACRENDGRCIPSDIVKKIISHKDLQPYFHFEITNRAPLQILEHLVDCDRISIHLAGEKIICVNKHYSKLGAFLQFSSYVIDNGIASIKLEYEIEGLEGIYRFKKSGNDWKLLDVKLWEN